MTALTVNTPRSGKQLGPVKAYPVLASTRIFQGAVVMITSAGFATNAAASAGNLGSPGLAVEEANNSAGANGAIQVKVQAGLYLLPATSIAQANVGASMFSPDNNAFDETQGANEPLIGVLEEFVSATSGWVRVGPLQVTRALIS